MNDRPARRGMTLEERQPHYEDSAKCPRTLTKTRHIDDVLYVAGRAPVIDQTEYEIMFVTSALEEDEATTAATSVFGMRIPQPAEYLKGSTGIIKDVALRAGIDIDRCYYTACCKWLLPRAQRSKPAKKIMKWGLPILEDEIKRVKPKIIVCLGKHVFDMLSPQKISFDDAHGFWFWAEEYQAHLYVMYAPSLLVGCPEYYEMFRIDFKEVARRKEILDNGGLITGQTFTHQVINNMDELEDWLSHLETLVEEDRWPGLRDEWGNPLLSVDAEWHGKTHIDGKLRTIQFAWSETEAVVIAFRDEKTEWSFDDSGGSDMSGTCTGAVMSATCDADLLIPKRYAAIGKKLFATFERIKARYIGHHFPADAPWMNHWLGMETYGKLEMDTEFAMQIVDESAELGLERLGMQFTNLGRYDFDLVMWKRENKELCQGGYGFIPSSILYSYAAADVIVPYRAYPMIKRQMEAQRLWSYYRDMFGPFSSDVFVEFCMTGLPMNVEVMDQLRHLFTFAKERLDKTFKRRMAVDATRKLKSKLIKEFGVLATKTCLPLIEERNGEALRAAVKQMLLDAGRLAEVPKWNKLLAHWEDSPAFNIRSSDQMSRWLFDFEGLTPIKSTNQKAKGLPSMAWEKVLELPPDRQALYKPAVDKQTLAILAEQLPAIDELLNLNAVGNLSKAFLREPSVYVDEDTGEEIFMERGLHSWLQHDGRIHPQTSSTETGRPRTFFPNVLNWPAVQNKRIALSVARCVQEAFEEGDLPENLLRWANMDSDDLPTIRSCVQAPEGHVLVESDYATAEMVALAVISGDADLARILFEPDPEWALLKSKTHGASVVRVAFADAKASGVPEEARNPEFIMHVWENGKCLGKVEESDLLRDENGAVLHARYDIHWSLIERTYGKFREMMKAKIARNAAKVLNFCLDGSATVPTRDRGAVAVRDIRLADWIWDGVEWVQHEGVIYTGRKQILEYQGLRATRLHDVWTAERGKVKLEEACVESLTLVRPEAPGRGDAAEVSSSATVSEHSGESGVGILLREDEVPSVRCRALEGNSKHGEELLLEVSMPESTAESCEVSGSRPAGNQLANAAVRGDETTVRDGYACVVSPIPWERHQGGIQGQRGLHQLGSGELLGRGDRGAGLRQRGERRQLLTGESASSDQVGESLKPRVLSAAELQSGQGVSGGASGSSLHLEDSTRPYEDGNLERRDFDEACAKFSCGEAETYDIVNAGPRHRFVCCGVLVSNSSAYGASENSLERKIEADTGVKPTPGTGERGLEAIRERQPRATEFLEEMAKVPKERGMYRAASGRIRHCLTHSAGSGVGWRTRNSIESALGREMRNYPMQESVGATSARACNWLLKAYRRLGMKSRPMICLYDSVVTLAPLEERFLAARLHKICMSEINAWEYEDDRGKRTLRYSIDNEFNYRWSTRPTEADQQQLDDREWNPSSPKWNFLENHPNLLGMAGLPKAT